MFVIARHTSNRLLTAFNYFCLKNLKHKPIILCRSLYRKYLLMRLCTVIQECVCRCVFSRVHSTLYAALSVGRSVRCFIGRSVGGWFRGARDFWRFSLLTPLRLGHAVCDRGLHYKWTMSACLTFTMTVSSAVSIHVTRWQRLLPAR